MAGDVGLPGPDHGKGGKYLVLPPDYQGEIPEGYFTYRSGTYGLFVFWRAISWSVAVYDPITGSGLDNGQPFPSLSTMDKPVQNADGTFDIYFGPKSPGEGKNYLATLPGKGWFTLFRLYGPKKEFFDQTWKPNDIEKV